MAQRWSTLLFMHWEVPVQVLEAIVPRPLALDLFERRAWVSIAPFYLSHLHARGLPPIPGTSAFAELNVRTYVTIGGKPGVYFFSLDASNALAVAGARMFYHLPYYRAAMSVRRSTSGQIAYSSRRTHSGAPPATFEGRYRPVGAPSTSAPGTLDHWLAERYCLYAVDFRRHIYRAEIHHRPWPLQPAEVEIAVNRMAEARGIEVAARPDRQSYAEQLDVVVWRPERVT